MDLHNPSAILCFVAAALVITTLILQTTAESYRISASSALISSNSSNSDSPETFLNVHNTYRAAVGVKNISWDDKIAAYAKNYANERKADCNLVHSNGSYGENFVWSSGNMTGTDAVMLWVSGKDDYDNKTNSCAAGKVCAHYAQVVWGTSIYLGCAKVGCSKGGTFVTCNYDPPSEEVAISPSSDVAPPPNSIFPFSPGPTVTISPTSVVASPPTVDPRTKPVPKGRKKRTVILAGGVVGGICAVILGLVCLLFCFLRKVKETETGEAVYNVSFEDEFGNGMGPRDFSYGKLRRATKNFDDEYKLGEGGFGAVYRGVLRESSTDVAVKRFSRKSKQGIKEYTSEVKIISRLRHKNLVKLLGWCHDKELLLVYELMPNGSLDAHLFKERSLLSWEHRYRIVKDLASALLYLHEEGDYCVLHRDIKASNIMLDSTFNAKLGDFGLARLVDHAKGAQTTQLAGTWGYMAPECHSTGKATKETDVYSFGVVVLEIVCGRRSIEPKYDEDQASLVAWVWEAFGNQRLPGIVDKKLGQDFDSKEMECLAIVGLWCLHPARSMRPTMRQAYQVLKFEGSFPDLPDKMPVINCDHMLGTSAVRTSDPHLSNISITIPR